MLASRRFAKGGMTSYYFGFYPVNKTKANAQSELQRQFTHKRANTDFKDLQSVPVLKLQEGAYTQDEWVVIL